MKKLKSIIIFLFLYVAYFQSVAHAEFHHVDDCYVCHDFSKMFDSWTDPSANKLGIRDIIQTPNSGDREVVFKDMNYLDDNYTDHADGNTLYDGICEVCHTKNNHHNNDGHDLTEHFDGQKCTQCHLHENEFAPPLAQSHRRHLEDVSGPQLVLCTVCHQDPYIDPTIFNDGLDLTNTTACDDCHSPGGTFPGINGLIDSDIGAKANFREGIYESDGKTLKAGKEKWCSTCHDEAPAFSSPGMSASVIVDNTEATIVGPWGTTTVGSYDNDSLYKGGGDGSSTVTWVPDIAVSGNYNLYVSWWSHWNRTTVYYTINHKNGSDIVYVNQNVGTAKPSGWVLLGSYDFVAGTSGSIVLSDAALAYRYISADAIKIDSKPPLLAPNVVGDNNTYGFYATGHKIACTECHDASKAHIDHEHRTYDVNENATYDLAINSWSDSYRLKAADRKSKEGLCLRCHNENAVLGVTKNDGSQTNFFDRNDPDFESGDNRHSLHILSDGFDAFFDSDFDGTPDVKPTCVGCHNVHGSSTGPMIRDGRLASDHNTTNRMPALQFSYTVQASDINATATWMPNLPAAGSYEVYAWWSDDVAAHDTPYIINHSAGSSIVRVNQQNASGPAWYHLGTFTFSGNASDSVQMTNDAYGYRVFADAVGWESSTGADGIPDIIVDNDNGTPDDPAAGTFSYTDSTLLTWQYISGFSPYGYGNDRLTIDNRPVVDTNATLAQSRGGKTLKSAWSMDNKVCFACHTTDDRPYYEREPFLGPKVINRYLDDRVGLNDGTGSVDIIVSVPDKNHNSSDITVVIDLTPLGGSAAQPMSDNGNGTYTHTVAIPFGQADVPLKFDITATDPASDVGTGVSYVYVAEPDTIYMDTDLVVKSPANLWKRASRIANVYGTDFEYTLAGTAEATATWNLDLNTTGKYEVFAWWPSDGATSIATDASYTINYIGSSETVIVDQRNDGNAWYSLGTYDFSSVTSGSVVLNKNLSKTVHADAIKLVRVNSSPLVRLSASQLDKKTRIIAKTTDSVILSAIGSDYDDDDTVRTLIYDWSANGAEILDNGFVVDDGYFGEKFSFDASSLSVGFHEVQVTVTDSHGASTTVKLALQVLDAYPVLGAVDTDGDGINDDVEGFTDFDEDGIPNYLDDDNTFNQIPAGSLNIVTQEGLEIRIGSTAIASDSNDGVIDIGDLNASGTGGESGLFDGATNIGGIFDFDVIGLDAVGQIVKVVIPLQDGATIPAGATYQKFDANTGWTAYVIDENNAVHSALAIVGVCPTPDSVSYLVGLNIGDDCIQLTIKDGGPNDADGLTNAEVKDPGGIFGILTSETQAESITYTPKSSGGSGSFTLWSLLMLGLFGIRRVFLHIKG